MDFKAQLTRGRNRPSVNTTEGFVVYLLSLSVNYFGIYNLSRSLGSIIHLAHPQHLVGCFELFGAAFFLCESLYKIVVHLLRPFINIGKIFVQLAFSEQVGVENRATSFYIAKVLLSPQADRTAILFGQC